MRRALAEAGVDPTAIDPLRILAAIAVNRSMPPTARVAACRALIAARDPRVGEASPSLSPRRGFGAGAGTPGGSPKGELKP